MFYKILFYWWMNNSLHKLLLNIYPLKHSFLQKTSTPKPPSHLTPPPPILSITQLVQEWNMTITFQFSNGLLLLWWIEILISLSKLMEYIIPMSVYGLIISLTSMLIMLRFAELEAVFCKEAWEESPKCAAFEFVYFYLRHV